MLCTLCHANAAYFCEDKRRQFYCCGCCGLIFADPTATLSSDEEKKLYDFHQNDPSDLRYRRFLSQLSLPLLNKLDHGMRGLDYGCGPGPTLNLLLEQEGMSVSLYDCFYFPDKTVLNTSYDFVTATEVVEHFNAPARDWRVLTDVLKPGGWLGVMTWMFTDANVDQFIRWSYKGDPTHISFYTPKTMRWIAQWLGLELHPVSDRVVLFKKAQQQQTPS